MFLFVDPRRRSFVKDTVGVFKQPSAPLFWAVKDDLHDGSMMVYVRSASYGAEGGSQDPTSMITPAQDLDTDTTDRSTTGANIYEWGNYMTPGTGGGADANRVRREINAVTLTPYYTHVIAATKD